MESSGLLHLLVLFSLFVNVQGPARSDQSFYKKCPRIKEKCEYKERDICTKDRDCPDNEKCCIFSCGRKCLDLQQDICTMSKDNGPCMAFFHRWWYNKDNNTCSTFIYGGCLGNNNNFQSKDICLNMCHKKRTCPRIRVKCEMEEMNQCTKHRHCPEKMKCCLFSCGKKCLDLRKGDSEMREFPRAVLPSPALHCPAPPPSWLMAGLCPSVLVQLLLDTNPPGCVFLDEIRRSWNDLWALAHTPGPCPGVSD
ncbi:eppin-like [Nycticebus coucang]|uniref:eppin-like n=1 Tax=Nycticebus coucang TaxID=9470 RepID=UPI00234C5A73|nr:eppin-like [Nycticebus coucang]